MSYEQSKTRSPSRVTTSTRRAVMRVKDRMREGGLLMRSNTVHGPKWYVLPHRSSKAPGREVEDHIAALVISEPEVYPSRDGIWPGHDQTYRIGEPS